MAVDIVTATQAEFDMRAEPVPPAAGPFTAVVIFDGQHWSALCRELDIASEGDQAEEAFWQLKMAVRESLAVAADRGVAPGGPVPDKALVEFMEGHRGGHPVRGYRFVA